MMVVSGIVLVLNTILSAVVGVRLLWRPADPGPRPERLLAIYFLLGAVLGNVTSSIAYGGWVDASLGVPPAVTTLLNGICLAGATLGAGGVYLFTARTFHGPGDPWQHGAFAGACLVSILAIATWCAEGLLEGFAIRVHPGAIHWLGISLRATCFAWAAGESLRYYAASKKRLRLGLSEPIVTNRFLLWGIWSIATGLLASAEIFARVVYYATTGSAAETAEAVRTVAQPMIFTTIAITSVLGSVAVSLLFLTFFPTAGFRRWVERSAAHAGVQ